MRALLGGTPCQPGAVWGWRGRVLRVAGPGQEGALSRRPTCEAGARRQDGGCGRPSSPWKVQVKNLGWEPGTGLGEPGSPRSRTRGEKGKGQWGSW